MKLSDQCSGIMYEHVEGRRVLVINVYADVQVNSSDQVERESQKEDLLNREIIQYIQYSCNSNIS